MSDSDSKSLLLALERLQNKMEYITVIVEKLKDDVKLLKTQKEDNLSCEQLKNER
jgi:hypothetical protein